MSNGKAYDLEERTFEFAKRLRSFVRKLPRTICNYQDVKQVVRSSGSIGANYIEANESFSSKDFRFRIKIARKEAKETRYWLRLLDTGDQVTLTTTQDELLTECEELRRILSSIIIKSEEAERAGEPPMGR